MRQLIRNFFDGRELNDPAAEKLRQNYLAEITKARQLPGCSNCKLNAIRRKYKEKLRRL